MELALHPDPFNSSRQYDLWMRVHIYIYRHISIVYIYIYVYAEGGRERERDCLVLKGSSQARKVSYYLLTDLKDHSQSRAKSRLASSRTGGGKAGAESCCKMLRVKSRAGFRA